MSEEQYSYEPPMVVEVGEFAELTQITGRGRAEDNPWFNAWWD